MPPYTTRSAGRSATSGSRLFISMRKGASVSQLRADSAGPRGARTTRAVERVMEYTYELRERLDAMVQPVPRPVYAALVLGRHAVDRTQFLIDHARLVTMRDERLGLLDDAALLVRDDRIAWIGRSHEAPA